VSVNMDDDGKELRRKSRKNAQQKEKKGGKKKPVANEKQKVRSRRLKRFQANTSGEQGSEKLPRGIACEKSRSHITGTDAKA